jgi:hypothetical protein
MLRAKIGGTKIGFVMDFSETDLKALAQEARCWSKSEQLNTRIAEK